MKTIKRYKETDYHYAKNYIVECPNCNKDARVTPKTWTEEANIKCNNCFYSHKSSEFIQYKAFAKINCPGCGKSIHTEQGGFKDKPKEITLTCTECDLSLQIKPRTEKYYLVKQTQGLKHDPVLGFPLWYQSEIKGNLFWAYNRKHLAAIQEYVDAELRERKVRYNRAMIYYLPQFIKNAKNRELVSNTIDKLVNK